MSDTEGSSNAHLPIEGVIGIIAGLVVLLLVLIIYIYCRLHGRQKRNSGILQGKQVTRRRGSNNSAKRTGIHKFSYRKSDDNDSLRPISGDSNHSFRFDASAMKARNQDGRISYDRPYSHQLFSYIIEESENAQIQPQKDPNSTEPVPAIVSNYGPVAMVSTGMYSGSRVSMSTPQFVSSTDSLIGQTNSRTDLITLTESPAASRRQVLSPNRLSHVLYAEPHKVKPSVDRQSHVLYAEPHKVKPSVDRQSHVIYAEPHKVKPSPDRLSHVVYAEPTKQSGSSDNRIVIRDGGEPQCRIDRAPMKIPKPYSQGHDIGDDPARQLNYKPQTNNVVYMSGHHDSFRSSQGLDLGADPKKAWKIYDQSG